MKKILFISVFLLIFFENLLAQVSNKVIFILHDNPNSSSYLLSIAEPLDGAHNYDITTFKQSITGSSNVEFIYKKQYPAIIQVDVDGRKFRVIMSPNTTVYVDIYPQISNRNWIVFHGDNAAGHKLYNAKPAAEWTMEIQKIFKDNEKNYSAINKYIENYVDAALYQIDSLKALKKISDSFAEVFKKDRLSMTYGRVINYYNYLFFATRDDTFTAADSIAIQGSEEKIFRTFPPLALDILAYQFGLFYLSSYFTKTYHDIDLLSDKRYIPLFNNDGRYGLLPEKLQKPMLGRSIASQYVFNINEYDKIKATAYFREKYPDSEYLPIIDKMAERYKQSQAEISKGNSSADTITTTEENSITSQKIMSIAPSNSGIYIDTSAVASNIKTLKELHATYFKGEKIFIDFWATWCRPCVQEFAYKAQLDSLLNLHNITPVFLSMDPPMLKKRWVQFIYNNKLTGYHFLINDTLTKDIRRIANYSDPLSAMPIPHYIYMDEQGNIIEKDAPRPSQIEKLADLFKEK